MSSSTTLARSCVIVKGITHTLVDQYDGSRFAYAALIPRDDLMPIWEERHRTSNELIESDSPRP